MENEGWRNKELNQCLFVRDNLHCRRCWKSTLRFFLYIFCEWSFSTCEGEQDKKCNVVLTAQEAALFTHDLLMKGSIASLFISSYYSNKSHCNLAWIQCPRHKGKHNLSVYLSLTLCPRLVISGTDYRLWGSESVPFLFWLELFYTQYDIQTRAFRA